MNPVIAAVLLLVYSYLSVHFFPLVVAVVGAFIVGYVVLEQTLTKSAPHMSTRRKLMMSSWGSPSEAQVYGTISVNAEPLMAWLAKQPAGEKPSVTTCAVKAVAVAMKEAPGFNSTILLGKFVPRPSVEVSCLVALDGGSDLAVAKISDADKKTAVQMHEELKSKAERLRKHADKDFESSKPLMALLPVGVLEQIVYVIGWMAGAVGMNIPALGVRPFPFGSAMVSSVGMLGVEQAFVPFTPFARVPFLLTVGECVPKPVVAADGKSIIVQQTLSLTGTIDHRFADGTDAARMAKKLKYALEHPDECLNDTVPMPTPEQQAKNKATARAAKAEAAKEAKKVK